MSTPSAFCARSPTYKEIDYSAAISANIPASNLMRSSAMIFLLSRPQKAAICVDNLDCHPILDPGFHNSEVHSRAGSSPRNAHSPPATPAADPTRDPPTPGSFPKLPPAAAFLPDRPHRLLDPVIRYRDHRLASEKAHPDSHQTCSNPYAMAKNAVEYAEVAKTYSIAGCTRRRLYCVSIVLSFFDFPQKLRDSCVWNGSG